VSWGGRLAREGERLVKELAQAHVDAIAERGYGKYYGVQSSWRPTSAGSHDVKQMSCIGWALEVTGAAYQAIGRGAVWTLIRRATVVRQALGTVLLEQLLKDGWTGVYWNPDTKNPADGSNEHPFSASVARSQKSYYKLRVSDSIVDYKATPPNRAGIEKLAKMPYWVGIARGGMHVFCGSRESVSEYHWDHGPTSTTAIEVISLESFAWLSGMLCFPPGVWESGGIPR
jgi:hypothetical protein